MDKKKLQKELSRQTEEIEKMIQADPEIKDMHARRDFEKEFYKKLGRLREKE